MASDDPLALERYERALATAEHLDVWNTDARIGETVARLGLSGLDADRRTGELSGGQRARLALAWTLLSRPAVLLLDEPTNHLDDAGTDYLRAVLGGWSGPVLLASHDRAFLDEVSTTIVDLDPVALPHAYAAELGSGGSEAGIGLTRFTGTYSDYVAARSRSRDRWERQYREEQEELQRLRERVGADQTHGHTNRELVAEVRMSAKFYGDRNAKVVSRRVQDARRRLLDLTEHQVRKPPEPLRFSGLPAAGDGRRSGAVVILEEVSVTGRLGPTSLRIKSGDKLLVTGPNGSGKSTLLHLIAGSLCPDRGTLEHPGGPLGERAYRRDRIPGCGR